ncbi:MAG: thiol-disulfide oxidoreductase DCC family protein [Acidobacteriota bacterium]
MSGRGSNPIVLYDGVCGLCNRLVQFVLKNDRNDVFRFASLQSKLAEQILVRHRLRSESLETVYVVLDYGLAEERVLSRLQAVVYVLQQLGGPLAYISAILRVLPAPVQNFLYGLVARNRYRVFGRYETCPLPDSDTRSKFLDL